jgi:hypothetical protein
VVLVDVEVALDVTLYVDQRMAAELFDHVIEEADPGGNVIGAGAIEIDLDGNVGLVRFAGDPANSVRAAHGGGLYR